MRPYDFGIMPDETLRRMDQDGRDWGNLYPALAREAAEARAELTRRHNPKKRDAGHTCGGAKHDAD